MNYTGPQFLTIKQAVNATGLSMYFLRRGIEAKTIPFVKSGNRYLINVPLLLEKLNKESLEYGQV